MKIQLFVLGWVLIAPSLVFSQKYDFTWLMGYSHQAEIDSLGISIINFNPDTLAKTYRSSEHIGLSFNSPNTSISDLTTGELIFYSNNVVLFDKTHERMKGSGQLNDTGDFLLNQGVIAFPHPKGESQYVLINGTRSTFATPDITYYMSHVWYSEIDMNANNGLGEVTVKQELLVEDVLAVGNITAVKHGNGRDWWVIFRKYCHFCERESYYRILITPEGWQRYKQTLIDFSFTPPTPTGLSQAVFTSDGTKYVVSNSIEIGDPHYIDIYDFDRCTGLLSNRQQIQTDSRPFEGDGGSGLAISSNGRFAYLTLWRRVLQYDLWADDIEASVITVAEYDGFVDIFPTGFFNAQLAPDGKIYIATTNGTRYLHVIHKPNEKGLACDLRQHDFRLPTFNSFSIPNYPNYRLYDFPDSPCDTLGINFDGTVTSTEDFTEEESTITVYPNPAFDVVYIEVEQPQKDLEIRLYSMLGELVTVQKDTVLDVHDLASGVYVVAVLAAGELIGTRKVVVQ